MKKTINITVNEENTETSIEGMSSVEILGHAERLKIIATRHINKELEEDGK